MLQVELLRQSYLVEVVVQDTKALQLFTENFNGQILIFKQIDEPLLAGWVGQLNFFQLVSDLGELVLEELGVDEAVDRVELAVFEELHLFFEYSKLLL